MIALYIIFCTAGHVAKTNNYSIVMLHRDVTSRPYTGFARKIIL